ncbi:MAG: 1-acyl-sn-glycerol-3-phosphate acyltransferase [bacterium]|nr:1-acyl-sn-glycerol-3-phosphate acyltransferase [bacterium]
MRKLRRVIITAPLGGACVVLMGLTSVVVSLFDSRGDTTHRAVAFWSRIFLTCCGIKVTARGTENVPQEGSIVLVANHLSLIDIPVLLAHLPVSFRFLAKTSLFRLPFIGWHLHRGGHIRVVREDKRASVKALGVARRVLEQGISVLVFAEGSRSKGKLQEFKAGAAHLAIRAGIRMVPIGLVGTEKVMPKGTFKLQPGRVALRIGEPIETTGVTGRDNASLTEVLREKVSELITEAAPATG